MANFTIYIDADACPKVLREFICKSAMRTQTQTVFVSNSFLQLPKSPFIKMKVVSQGFDVADDDIVTHAKKNDLAITSDIPLANDLIDKGVCVINFKGMMYTTENIKQSLNMRDFMDVMRGTGVLDPSQMGGQNPFSDKDKKAFADSFNKIFDKLAKQQ